MEPTSRRRERFSSGFPPSTTPFERTPMMLSTVKRLTALGAIAVLPIACAPGTSGVMPATDTTRATQSGGPAGGGGGGLAGGGGGGGAAGGGGGGGAAACQPLPGTCVLNAT